MFIDGIRKNSDFIFFSCGYMVILEPFVEKFIVVPSNCLSNLKKKEIEHRYRDAFLEFQFDFIDLYVYPYTTTTLCLLL